jgi:hypothetical protein
MIPEHGLKPSPAEHGWTLVNDKKGDLKPVHCPKDEGEDEAHQAKQDAAEPAGTTKCWPCKSNPVRLGSYVSRAVSASGDCGLSAGVLASRAR